MRDPALSPLLVRLWGLINPPSVTVIGTGAYSAILGWRPGAFLAAGGMFGVFGSHMVIALIAYRRVMSRPWPKVAPLTDHD